MTVTFTLPQSFNPFGGGYTLHINSSYVGAKINPRWVVEIIDHISGGATGISQNYLLPNGSSELFIAYAFDTLLAASLDPRIGQGIRADLSVGYIADGALRDSDTLPVTMDWAGGRIGLLALQSGLGSSPTTLAKILAAVTSTYRNAP